MNLEEQIYIRKSCRNYSDGAVDMDLIHKFMESAKSLNNEINCYWEILTRDKVAVRNSWSAPYYLAIYSEKKDNYLTNIGFIFQQLCLCLQSMGIGSCWVGLDVPKRKNSEFVIAIAFGMSRDISRDLSEFKRKELSEISDFEDEKLIPAQLAPSAINSQPWYFKHSNVGFDVYQIKHNILKRQILKRWNPIDVGIALAHMYVANKHSFEFEIKDNENIKGYSYIGSIKI
ncbi:nitroreductase family protein [Methanobrevibacter sp.]|uniref:nitroreductase family protein n=1 Tax=Methanobrevibacter sp. TaxID=66852 RepID=UPI0026E00DE7|nr:nitroreductase family protein [Methanobrevibacter sp.]MDO5823035.1 nitroreductase family protein [Methanobrevibacter sp.]